MIHPSRIRVFNESKSVSSGRYVLYWMHATVRSEENHALEYAILEANERNKPLIVLFVLTDLYLSPTLRSYQFLIEGLQDVAGSLMKRNIRLVVKYGDPVFVVSSYAEDAVFLITDMAYLSLPRLWQSELSGIIPCPMSVVESNLIVPVSTVSTKEEWSAATFRKKITPLIKEYLVPPLKREVKYPSLEYDSGDVPLEDCIQALAPLTLDRTVLPSPLFSGGETKARILFEAFLTDRLDRYESSRNDPAARVTSMMSAYLHFGQVSPSYLARKVIRQKSPGGAAFLEQLIVRRELAFNYCHYNQAYDRFEGLPSWVHKTLNTHASDIREYEYGYNEFENAQTHDPAWNAMQTELVLTGTLHGYLRMYWGKKILEWTKRPEEGYEIAVRLNDKFELDGRDPNGYTGVAWCFGKHDRPWKERPVFGMIRYMNDAGLRRKFRLDAYITRIGSLKAQLL